MCDVGNAKHTQKRLPIHITRGIPIFETSKPWMWKLKFRGKPSRHIAGKMENESKSPNTLPFVFPDYELSARLSDFLANV